MYTITPQLVQRWPGGGVIVYINPMVRPTVKDRSLVRSRHVQLRVRDDQYRRWEAAARKHGRTLAAWMAAMLDRAARTG